MRRRILPGAACSALALAMWACVALAAFERAGRPIAWQDVAPVVRRLGTHGSTPEAFASYVERVRDTNARRVREGDLDHLIFYLLQSTHFTKLPAIEPAISAKALAVARGLEPPALQEVSGTDAPPAVRARAAALLRALESDDADPRLAYFRELVSAAFPARRDREAALLREYVRVMRFVYEKEFVAQRSEQRTTAVAELYRTRGLSTDTAVEAGFLVSEGLAVARALDPGLRIRRVLIVGPGLDLAPRTGLLEAAAPESYQPWAVVDALLALGLSRIDDLAVVGADINPRVVGHLRRARGRARTLTFVTGIREIDGVTFTPPFRQYFTKLGSHLGGQNLRRDREAAERSERKNDSRWPCCDRRPASEASRQGQRPPAREARVSERGWGPASTERSGAPGALSNADSVGHISKVVRVDPEIARILDAERIDIVTERLTGEPFDLIVATNILPYFDDAQLALAMVNIAGMLAPGGTLLHNEGRPSLGDLSSALGLPLEHSRHAVIATVRGAPPLADSVWMHRKVKGKG